MLLAAAVQGRSEEARLVGVRYESALPVDREELDRFLAWRIGQPVGEADLARARQLLAQKEIYWTVDVTLEPSAGGAVAVVKLGRKRVVNRVRVRGFKQLRGKEVRRVLRVPGGSVFDPDLVDAAAERLRTRYKKEGFVEAQVEAVVDLLDESDVNIAFHIVEGEPEKVVSAVVEGELGELRAPLEKAVKGLAGERRTRELQRRGEREIVRVLRRSGYYEARVKSLWQVTSGKEGILVFAVEAGPSILLEVVGNEAIPKRKLLGLIDLEQRLFVTDGTWRDLARLIKRAYQDAGYYRAAVEVEVDDEGRSKRVTFRVSEGRRYVVRSVVFKGNEAVPAGKLLDRMVTRPARPAPWSWIPRLRAGVFVDETFDDDLRRLWFYYRERGWESAEIVDAPRRFDEERGWIHLEIVVDEGPRTVVREVRQEGIEGLDAVAALPPLRTRAGLPLREKRVDRDARDLREALGRLGYASARVEPLIERRETAAAVEATVTFRVAPGEQRRVGRIIPQGNIETRDRVILREVPFKPGDPLSTEAMLEAQTALYRLNLFRSVSVRPLSDAAVTDVGVQVSERARGRLEIGGGYNTRDGFGGFAEVGYDNISGLNRSLSLRGQMSLAPTSFVPQQYLLNLGYREPYVADSRWKLLANMIAERATRTIEPFDLERFTLVTSIDRPLLDRLDSGIELQGEYSNVFDVEDDVELSPHDEGSLYTVALSPFFIFDGRNDPFAPSRGVFDTLRLRWAVPGASTVHFAKLTLQHSQHIALPAGMTLVYAVRGGLARPFDSNEQMPIRERFFLGGRSTVRGFDENSVGPEGAKGHPTGGDLALNLNAELRIPIYGALAAAVFADGGGVYLLETAACEDRGARDCHTNLDNFRRSAGIGLRYLTPVGPLSVDYGFKLDRRSGESLGAFHFSVGSTF